MHSQKLGQGMFVTTLCITLFCLTSKYRNLQGDLSFCELVTHAQMLGEGLVQNACAA